MTTNQTIENLVNQKFNPISQKIDETLNNEYLIGASIITNMSEEERDNLDPANAVGGYSSYMLYEAQKLLPKPSDKLKRITDDNSFVLYQYYNQIVNVNGIYYGISHYDDPDDEDEYVFAYHRLDKPNSPMIETSISVNDSSELIVHLKEIID